MSQLLYCCKLFIEAFFYAIHETNYTDHDMPSPGASLSTPGDRQHVDKQAFPCHPNIRRQITQGIDELSLDSSEYTRGQTTQGHKSLLLAPISVCQETDYMKTLNESSPGAPLGGPRDRLHKDKHIFPWSPSKSIFHWHTFSTPGDRLQNTAGQAFPWHPFRVHQGTD